MKYRKVDDGDNHKTSTRHSSTRVLGWDDTKDTKRNGLGARDSKV